VTVIAALGLLMKAEIPRGTYYVQVEAVVTAVQRAQATLRLVISKE
jgi:hypothetical protein